MRRYLCYTIGVLSLATASATGQVPLFDLNVDSQAVGSDPQADLGHATAVPHNVTVDGPRTGMTGNTIHLQRVDSTPRLFCQPLAGVATTGHRVVSFAFDFPDVGAPRADTPPQFDVFLRPQNLNTSLLDLNVDLETKQVTANGDALTAVAAGATHVVSINVDVDAHTCLIMIDGTSFSHAWTAGISEFALVEFAMSTNDPNRGDAHVDSILIVDSGRVLASWASPVSGDWIDGVNWSGAAAPVSGDAAFIRQPSAGAYTV